MENAMTKERSTKIRKNEEEKEQQMRPKEKREAPVIMVTWGLSLNRMIVSIMRGMDVSSTANAAPKIKDAWRELRSPSSIHLTSRNPDP